MAVTMTAEDNNVYKNDEIFVRRTGVILRIAHKK